MADRLRGLGPSFAPEINGFVLDRRRAFFLLVCSRIVGSGAQILSEESCQITRGLPIQRVLAVLPFPKFAWHALHSPDLLPRAFRVFRKMSISL